MTVIAHPTLDRWVPPLDRLVPAPRLREVDRVALALPLDEAWARLRHVDLAATPVTSALFALRTLPTRLARRQAEAPRLRIDDLRSEPDQPGFALLVDEAPRAFAVGAIGQVWRPDIAFVHVPDAAAFASYDQPGQVKVAWSVSLTEAAADVTEVALEVRVTATDEVAWRRFRRYFRAIGPGSRLIRRRLLGRLARDHSLPAAEAEQAMPGDGLLADSVGSTTHGARLDAPPSEVWPWLVQLGSHRAGFYSLDLLDNGGRGSAREIHPEWQDLHVGDIIPATPTSDEGFEVLEIAPPRGLVLGGLYDTDTGHQLPFDSPPPPHFWHVTWAFRLEPWPDGATRLTVRVQAAHDGSRDRHLRWIRPVHHVMQAAQLKNLAARVEHRLPRDDWRDVLDGALGAMVIAGAAVTPFLRHRRNRWGLERADATRSLPGDDLIDDLRWQWTHGTEVDAPPAAVWPWVAQVGADRGGFYSHQWLENLVGCDLRNAETLHPEWQLRQGDRLVLHPDGLSLPIVSLEPGRHLVAHAAPDPAVERATDPWVEITWLFFVEALDGDRSRVVSRFRCACSDDLATRLQYGPGLLEPVGFAMDRRMLLGIAERAERSERGRRATIRDGRGSGPATDDGPTEGWAE